MHQIKRMLFLFIFWGMALHLLAQVHTTLPDYEEGAIYLKIADNSDFEIIYPPNGQQSSIYTIFDNYGVTQVVKPFKIFETKRFDRIYKVYFKKSAEVLSFIEELGHIPFVEFSERVPQNRTFQTFPNDPSVPIVSYQLDLIDAYNAFDLHQGGNATVAIVDNAVMMTHEDLAANIVAGRDVADDDDDPNPPFPSSLSFSHGTLVSGIAGAVTDNNIGVAAIGWGNRIMPVKCTKNVDNPIYLSAGYQGIAWAVMNGANVLNLSWGSDEYSECDYMVLAEAREHNVIIVAAAGNSSTAAALYPAAYGEGTTGQIWEAKDASLVIAVASIDADGKRSVWPQNAGSNYGSWVDVAAYGTGIHSCVAASNNGNPVNDQYRDGSGTSMASPLVAGLAGLMVSFKPNATDEEIIDCLLNTANDDIYSVPGNLLGTLGAGRINAFDALRCINGGCTNPIAYIIPSSTTICQNGSVTLTANQGIGYAWSTGETTQSIMVELPSEYSVTVTFQGTNGTCMAKASKTIVAAPTEAIMLVKEGSGAVNDDGILCGETTVFLSAYWGLGYHWSWADWTQQGLPGIRPAEITMPVTSGISVTVTDVGGCQGVTDVVTVEITWLPNLAVDITVEDNSGIPNDGKLCMGNNAILTSSGGTSILWSTGETTASISVSPPDITTYSVTVTNEYGCTNENEITIFVEYPTTFASITVEENAGVPNDNTICIGQSASLKAEGGYLYVWSTGQTTAQISVSPIQTTTYKVTATNETGCTEEKSVELLVVDCNVVDFSCPCTATNTLNIEADDNGTPYSSLNLPTKLNGSEYHGCIALKGRLIIDEDVTITNCPDIRMQPAAEIVVNPKMHLTVTQNTIRGCEKMWRGITVLPNGYLTFQDNDVQDAQHTITANASTAYDLGQLPTRIEVQRNDFARNHISVFANGGPSTNLWHFPFTRNHFAGDGGVPLLPPCDPDLPNWEANSGYAGVISRGVNFTVGNANDVGITNTFTGLRNGVIGEKCWLQVYHASFTDMVGTWTDEQVTPSIGYSFGTSVVASLGFHTVRNCTFDGVGHGIFADYSILTATNNDMPKVYRGIEATSPFSLNLSDNHDIHYRSRGIIVRNPFVAFFSGFSINRNILFAQEQEFGMFSLGIDVRNATKITIPNARMHKNQMFLRKGNWGIVLTNLGKWTMDENYIQHQGSSLQVDILGGVFNSRENYFYHNTFEDISNEQNSTAFNVSASTENTFCCNITNGTAKGYNFFGDCSSTAFRTTDMSSHQQSLSLYSSTWIGEQGVFSNVLGGFENHGNIFNASSGTAENLATNQLHVAASRFHVLSDETPDFPEHVSTPNLPTSTWFDTDGKGEPFCTDCVVPPIKPTPRGAVLDAGDKIIAGDGFGNNSPGERMMQWEGMRSLYQRMKDYPTLLGQDAKIDQFYNKNSIGQIGAYYEADKLVEAVNTVSNETDQAMKSAYNGLLEADSMIEMTLADLEVQRSWADSMAVYHRADQIRAAAATLSDDLVRAMETHQGERGNKAIAALPVVGALLAENVLEKNRKAVLQVYLQTFGQGIQRLTEEQYNIVYPIAKQCPSEGGSAVYIAIVLCNAIREEDLCHEQVGERSEKTNTVAKAVPQLDILPNPAANQITIVGLQDDEGQTIAVSLYDATGHIMVTRKCVVGQGLTQVSLEGVPDGLYFCRINTGGSSTSTLKLIVHR